jgi:hypothetical protein
VIRDNQLSTTENNRQKVSQVKKPQGQNEVEKQSVSPVADLQTGINKAAGGQTGGRETDGHKGSLSKILVEILFLRLMQPELLR